MRLIGQGGREKARNLHREPQALETHSGQREGGKRRTGHMDLASSVLCWPLGLRVAPSVEGVRLPYRTLPLLFPGHGGG